MKYVNFFLIFSLYLTSCSEPEEEVMDLDQMVMREVDVEENFLREDGQISLHEEIFDDCELE